MSHLASVLVLDVTHQGVSAVHPCQNGRQRHFLAGLKLFQSSTVRATVMLSDNTTIASTSVEVYVSTPILQLFHPMDNQPALMAPGLPLDINFGLAICNSRAPDCFADFQGAQFSSFDILLDGHVVATSETSRLNISMEQLPHGFWTGASRYAAGADMSAAAGLGAIQRQVCALTIDLHALGGERGLMLTQDISLVAVLDASAISPGLASFYRHEYAHPPMSYFGDRFWEVLSESGGANPFFGSVGAASRRESSGQCVQPEFRDPWVPDAAGPPAHAVDDSSAEHDAQEESWEAAARSADERRRRVEVDAEAGGHGTREREAGGRIYAYSFVSANPLDFIFQVRLFRKFVAEGAQVSFSAVLNMDPLDPEHRRVVARWRAVARELEVGFIFLPLSCDRRNPVYEPGLGMVSHFR